MAAFECHANHLCSLIIHLCLLGNAMHGSLDILSKILLLGEESDIFLLVEQTNVCWEEYPISEKNGLNGYYLFCQLYKERYQIILASGNAKCY